MKYTRVEDFISEILPSIIRGKSQFNAIFSTYNSVEGYEAGPVNTGKVGLSITVSGGGHDQRIDLVQMGAESLSSGDIAFMRNYLKAEETSATESQLKAEQSLGITPEVTLVVAYAGFSAPRVALDLHPGSRQNHRQFSL